MSGDTVFRQLTLADIATVQSDAILHGISAQPRAQLLTTFIDMGKRGCGCVERYGCVAYTAACGRFIALLQCAYRFMVDTHDTDAPNTNTCDSATWMESLTVNFFGHGADELPPLEPEFPPFSDPTTFRSILLPNAVIPKRGSILGGIVGELGLEVDVRSRRTLC
jgi:hypothetical protein